MLIDSINKKIYLEKFKILKNILALNLHLYNINKYIYIYNDKQYIFFIFNTKHKSIIGSFKMDLI